MTSGEGARQGAAPGPAQGDGQECFLPLMLQSTATGGFLKNKKMYPFTVLETGSRNQGFLQGQAPSMGSREEFTLPAALGAAAWRSGLWMLRSVSASAPGDGLPGALSASSRGFCLSGYTSSS